MFLLALLVRLAFLAVAPPIRWGGEMTTAAKSLAETGTLGNIFTPGPSAHVTPVYPALLAVLYRIWGYDYVLPQCILASCLTAFAIASTPALAWRLGLSRGSGLAAGLTLALLPVHSIEMSGEWEQPLAAVCLAGLLYLGAELQDRSWQSPARLLAFGLLLAVGGLAAPILLPVGGLIWLGQWLRGGTRPIRLLGAAFLLSFICSLVWAPWIERNYRRMGGFVPLRSNFGLELSLGNSPGADGTYYATKHLHPLANPAEAARLRALGEVAYMKEKQRFAVEWIRNHPLSFTGLCLRRTLLFWFPTPFFCAQSNPLAGAVIAAILSISGFLSLGGLLVSFVNRWRYRWLLLAGLVGPSLVYAVTHVAIRYRYPVFNISMLLAWEAVLLLAWRLRVRASGGRAEDGALLIGQEAASN